MDWGADMLSIKNLQFGHGSYIVVAENTAFGGGVYGVIGPSGSGKSTFLNTLAGFHEAESGSAMYEHRDLLTQRVIQRNFCIIFYGTDVKCIFIHCRRSIIFLFSHISTCFFPAREKTKHRGN